MKVIKINPSQYSKIDVLVRVYKNQADNYPEKQQCLTEILFKSNLNIDHERFSSWLPRGAAAAISSVLNKYKHLDITVGISNEFELMVGVLTSVPENFDKAIVNELKNINLSITI